MRLALCDDNAGFRGLLEAVLGADPGFELVAVAAGIDELLERLPPEGADGVLLDWLMPGVDQADAVRRVRAVLPDACIVVVSAVVRSSAEEHALAAGANGYVEKGPGGRELVERCRAFLLPS